MQDFRKEAKMGAIMKIVRKFAKEYQDGYEEELTKIARTASVEEMGELQRVSMTIQDIMLFRLSLEQAAH